MSINRSLFSSASEHWATPTDLYNSLNDEFHFNDDPCPLHGEGGLDREWGTRTYCNPPYKRGVTIKWLKKGYEESLKGKLVVFLLPSRTDNQWWHEYVMKASEIRFVRGRLKFGGSKTGAPFPSAIVIFSPILYGK